MLRAFGAAPKRQFAFSKGRFKLAAPVRLVPSLLFSILVFHFPLFPVRTGAGERRGYGVTASGGSGAPPLRTLPKGLSPSGLPFCCRVFGAGDIT